MSVATELRSPAKSHSETRAILGPTGNRVRVSEEAKRKKEGLKRPQKPSRLVSEATRSIVLNNSSLDSTSSLESSSGGSSVKMVSSKRRVKPNGSNSVKVVPDGVDLVSLSLLVSGPVKRCDWITPNSGKDWSAFTSSLKSSSGGFSVKMVSSKRRVKPNGLNSVKVVPDEVDLVSLSLLVSDPLYTSFHDEEWGVPVLDDRRLFELLVLSQALAEFTWPAILNRRDIFRKLFDNFDPSFVAKFTEKKLLSLRSNGSTLLSEPKLRAIVDNANQTLKQLLLELCKPQAHKKWIPLCTPSTSQDTESRAHKQGFDAERLFRYARQVPVKTPKAELISKDLMQRGFRCVGPSVVYSFMQVAGLTNDHLVTCFRYRECNTDVKKDLKPKNEDTEVPANTLENKCSAHD
ncbi:hypothetical protein TEA_005599 [Camellia sinensis var. sinensis]|uniref:Uncharacterized protein n=1 Tax=Camellia sinensis var. sinensis TaxID=542762 RepID=A0A4S4EJ31_CAMSN|nr:hypothetical protein TEA_005599 [Camellia sinensis var. sinensis]